MSKRAYQEAFEELQQIVADIEDGQISVDELSEKVSRASALIKICKAKLTSTEENVQKILADLEQPEQEEDYDEEDYGGEEEDFDEDEKGGSESGRPDNLPF